MGLVSEVLSNERQERGMLDISLTWFKVMTMTSMECPLR